MLSKEIDYKVVLEGHHRYNEFGDLLRMSGNSATKPLKVDIFVACQQCRVPQLQLEDVFVFCHQGRPVRSFY